MIKVSFKGNQSSDNCWVGGAGKDRETNQKAAVVVHGDGVRVCIRNYACTDGRGT